MFHSFFDSHTHSKNSPDGKDAISDMCRAAAQKGLKGFVVTDHCECEKYQEDGCRQSLWQSGETVRQERERWKEQFQLGLGLELGQPLQNLEAAEEILSLQPYDFVLCSLHAPRGREDYYFLSSKEMTQEEVIQYLDCYYQELLEMSQWGNFDIMGHLTYPLRYIQGRDGREVDLRRYDDLFEQLMKNLISQGKGIEANTSGYRQNMGEPVPGKRYLRLFRELGGELITLGSDAHQANLLGEGIQKGMALLKEIGFSYFAFYHERKPQMYPIE